MARNFDTSARDWDGRHLLHPWGMMEPAGPSEFSFLESGGGIHVTASDGRKLIDGPGGMWCVQIGYGRREMAEAIGAQALELPYYSPFNAANSVSAQLAAKLAELAPGDLNRVFFTTGGSTAVDTAIRFIHFRNNIRGLPDKKMVISREGAYHGSTYLAAAVTGKDRYKYALDVGQGHTHLLPQVCPSRRSKEQSEGEFLAEKVADLEAAILQFGANKVAAFIAEPVLASGGVIVPPEGYHAACAEICRAHDVVYIADEVVTGFGRLGEWFASDAVFGAMPDIITSAKGLTSGYQPLGACIISDALVADIEDSGECFAHGFTYSGHPVAAAAALKNIEIFEREGILQHVREVTPHFQERLEDLRAHPMVIDTRGAGLLGCVECSPDGIRSEATLERDAELGALIDAECQARGLMLRPIVNQCVFSPPLIITRNEIDQMFDIIGASIDAAGAKLGVL